MLMTNTMGRFAGTGRETFFQQAWALNKPVYGNNHFYDGATPTAKLNYWNNSKSNYSKLSWGMTIGEAADKVKGKSGHTKEPRLGFSEKHLKLSRNFLEII